MPVSEIQSQVDLVRRPVVTVETAGYIGLALLAAGLRLYQLGAAPLAAREASEAMAAWRLIHPGPAAPTPTSPLLFGAMAVLFALTGGSDAAARLLPALAGSALVLTPALFRQWLGRGGALMAAALLALSPSMIYASRIAAPEILAMLSGVALTASLLGYLRSSATRWLYVGAIALGLGLVSGPLIYSILALGILAGLALWSQASDEARANARAAYMTVRDEPGLLARLGATAAATLVLGATVFMAFPAGLGTAGDILAAWASGFGGARWVGYPLQLVVLYEPMALILGIGGLIAAVVTMRQESRGAEEQGGGGDAPVPLRPPAPPLLLGAGALAALLLAMLRRGGAPGEVLLVVYPLALLGGPLLADVFTGLRRVAHREAAWGLAAALVIIAATSAIYLGLYAHEVGTIQPEQVEQLQQAQTRLLLAALLPIAGMMLVALAVTWERSLWRPALAVLVAVLVLYTIGMGWGLAQLRPNDPREPWVTQPTSEQVRMLVETLEQASGQRVGIINELPVTVQTTGDDVLPWYLRDFVNLTFTDKLGAQVNTPAVITLDSEQPPELGGAYTGADFVLRTRARPEYPNETDWIRWLTIRSGMITEPDSRVVLWIQAPGSGQQ